MAKKIRKRQGGRPTKLNKKAIEDLELAFMLGATIEIASMTAGISAGTFYLWQREGEAVERRLNEEQVKVDQNEQEIILANELGEPIPELYEPDLKITPREALLLKFIKTMREAEALGAMEHLQNIQRAAKVDAQLSVWILQNRHGYGRSESRIVHAGDPENPIVTQDVSEMSLEDRAARIALILQSAEKRKSEEVSENDSDPDPMDG